MNTDEAEQLLEKDKILLIKELSGTLNMSKARVHYIIAEDYGKRCVYPG
jgi:hypothetical protein